MQIIAVRFGQPGADRVNLFDDRIVPNQLSPISSAGVQMRGGLYIELLARCRKAIE